MKEVAREIDSSYLENKPHDGEFPSLKSID